MAIATTLMTVEEFLKIPNRLASTRMSCTVENWYK